MSGAELSLRICDEDVAETVENAIAAVEDELGQSVSRQGRPAEGQITVEEAVEDIAAAYAGWSA